MIVDIATWGSFLIFNVLIGLIAWTVLDMKVDSKYGAFLEANPMGWLGWTILLSLWPIPVLLWLPGATLRFLGRIGNKL